MSGKRVAVKVAGSATRMSVIINENNKFSFEDLLFFTMLSLWFPLALALLGIYAVTYTVCKWSGNKTYENRPWLHIESNYNV